jgi:DNA-binding transcriptional LysR family regulator
VPLGLYLANNLHRLLDEHPQLSVDLVLRDYYGNLVADGLDAQVREGDRADSSLISRRIGATSNVLVAAPRYLTSRGAPQHPSGLSEHCCIIHQRAGNDDVWWFTDADSQNRNEISVAVAGRISTNNAAAVYRAALAGHGIACLSILLVGSDIAAGRLVRLLSEYPCRRYPIYIDYPSRRHLPLRVRVVIDFIALLAKELLFPEKEPVGGSPITG